MDENSYINKNYTVYFSYAGNKEGNSELEEPIKELRKLLSEANIDYRDYKVEGKTPFTYRRPMMESEEEIGRGHIIVVVLSVSYIESSHCMYEWYNIVHNPAFEKRIFPIYLDDLRERLNNSVRTKKLGVILSNMYDDIASKEAEGSVLSDEEKFILNLGDKALKNELKEIIRYYRNNSVPKLERFDYEVLLEQIQDRIKELEPSPNPIVEKQFSAPSFKFATQSNLVGRDNMVEKLYDLVSKNSFSNLNGFGGSGKTSLTYLFLQKYSSEFNQVAYIVVNNDIKADFVSQINDTIHLFKPKEDERNGSRDIQDVMKNAVRERENLDRYQAIISYLESNYKSDKPNLLIIDINNVPDGDIAKFGDDLANNTLPSNKIYPDGWKYLIVSREMCKSLAKMNLNKNESQNTDFLKELFLKNAGNQYKDFSNGDFAELFKTIYYSPLLAEQLGIFLQDFPKRSVSQIAEILHKDSFKEEKRTGITSQNRSSKEEKTIIGFLRNIIVFDNLKEKEKTLLKHFVLWPTDYIPKNVVIDLLKGLFDEEELENVLTPLVRRRIIAVQEVDGVSSYKLHGLLAESLREQIDISNEDYTKYLDNIERIIEYGYYDFLPYVDCIGNSLCEYEITTNYYSFSKCISYSLINCVGKKLNDSWKYDYCQRLLEKNIAKIEDDIELDSDNPSLQEQLALAHVSIANGQISKSNYETVVEILEQMPKDVERYQHALALAYQLLAGEQSTYENVVSIFDKIFSIRQKLPKTSNYQRALADDYNAFALLSENFYNYLSAEKSYNKAIEIGEELPKDNPEYQYKLASSYMSLADFQDDRLGDYESAKSNYEKALAIRERLLKDNPEYQNGLAGSYNNLAVLQSDHLGDYESAEKNYNKALEIREELPKDNPEYQDDLARVYNNLADLQENRLGDYESAKSNYEKALAIREKLPKDNPGYQNDLAGSYRNLAILQENRLGDYESAKSNYEKALAIREKLPKDNPEYQNDLASSYNGLANLQSDHLEDYESAEKNYNKAIVIGEQLPKDNPLYLSNLAIWYNNLAILYKNDYYKDYESAENNYNKAIEIREKLPKDNPEYQNGLASSYNGLANLQSDHLGDCGLAETNFTKAIEIREKISKDNPECQNDLADSYNGIAYCYSAQKKIAEAFAMVNKAIDIAKGLSDKDSKYLINWINYKHSLAEMFFNNNESEKAKEILEEIKPLAKKCLDENPNDSWTQSVIKEIDELLEKCS